MQTTETARPKSQIPEQFPTLQLLYSPECGVVRRTFCLRSGRTDIGRDISEAQGIRLDFDSRASRRHAFFELIKVQGPAGEPLVQLTNTGSKNGTFVNGLEINTTKLFDGNVIRIGDTIFLLRTEPSRPCDGEMPRLVGQSPVMGQLRHRLTEVTRSDAPLLLLGDPGVGKEVAARSVHEHSRRVGPFLACNCAGLTESLADGLLFGHERGSFTGASESREGLFRAAEGGTLFLDEVAELSLPVQAKLLRVLQEHEILPLGRTRPTPVNVRVITATNLDLEEAVRAGRFRDDLYSRLRGAVVNLPRLRDRREDILPLLVHILGGSPRLAPRLAEALLLYHWPHNVRELTHFAEEMRQPFANEEELDLPLIEYRLQTACTVQAPYPLSRAAPSFLPCRPSESSPDALETANDIPLTRETWERLGRETGWNKTHLSRLVGLSRRQVGRWLEKYGLDRPRRGASPP